MLHNSPSPRSIRPAAGVTGGRLTKPAVPYKRSNRRASVTLRFDKKRNTRYMSICRSWCYTLNNPTEEEIKGLKALDPEKIACHVFAHEVGEQGTPHLQGYVRFKKPCRLSWWKNQLPRVHVETRRGTEQQAWNYCVKDGNILFTYGEPMQGQVYATSSEETMAIIEEIEAGDSFVDIRARHRAFVFNKRRQVLDYMKDHRRIQAGGDPFEDEEEERKRFRSV